MGMGKNRVEEVVNVCIENPLGGSAIDTEGEEMQDLVAYLKTLVAKKEK
jgi:cytochrome c